MMAANETLIGVDLGGTYVRAGAINSQGRLLASSQTLIKAEEGGEAGVKRITALIEAVLKDSGRSVIGIGIGATGPVDRGLGAIQNPYTLPTWENVPVVGPLAAHFGVPVVLENDADAAALGEYWIGAGQGVRHLYAVTVGTGIGTACILDGKVLRGVDGSHPEGGHHIIDPSGPTCYCGANGCWEVLAAGPGIARLAQECAAAHPDSLLWQMAQGDSTRIDGRLAADAARQNDPCAVEIMEKAAYYFSLGLVNVINLFTPEVIVLSGGVMHSLDLFRPTIDQMIQRHSLMVPAEKIHILLARLGYQAGLYGAAYAIYQEVQGSK